MEFVLKSSVGITTSDKLRFYASPGHVHKVRIFLNIILNIKLLYMNPILSTRRERTRNIKNLKKKLEQKFRRAAKSGKRPAMHICRTKMQSAQRKAQPRCSCEFFIVQHGQGSNNGKRRSNNSQPSYESMYPEVSNNANGVSNHELWDEFPIVPKGCEITRMAFPPYVFMSTDELNEVFRQFVKEPTLDKSFQGSFYQVMKSFMNRADLARTVAANFPLQPKSGADREEPENNMKYLLYRTLQRFPEKSKYFDEILEGDITNENNNDFGVWMRCKFDSGWKGWVQIFGQNGAWKKSAKTRYGKLNVAGSGFNTWRYHKEANFDAYDQKFMEITSAGDVEYRISSLISFLKRNFSPACKANFIFANCSAMGQQECPVDPRLTRNMYGDGWNRRPEPFDLGSQLISSYSISQNTHGYAKYLPDHINSYWIKLLKTLYYRIILAKAGNKYFVSKLAETPDVAATIWQPEFGECLTIMGVGERREWYQVIGSLLNLLKIKQNNGEVSNELPDAKGMLEYIIKQGAATLYEGGISPLFEKDYRLADRFVKYGTITDAPAEKYISFLLSPWLHHKELQQLPHLQLLPQLFVEDTIQEVSRPYFEVFIYRGGKKTKKTKKTKTKKTKTKKTKKTKTKKIKKIKKTKKTKKIKKIKKRNNTKGRTRKNNKR